MGPLQLVFGAIVILLMLGLGATITITDFKHAVRVWKAPLTAVICQFGVMPLLAFCLATALGVTKQQGLSMLVVGCSPGGSTSNLFTYYSHGDLALSIIATSFSTLLAIAFMPLTMLAYSSPFTDDEVKIPYTSLILPLVMVLAPVTMGMLVKHKSSRWAHYVEKAASYLGMAFIMTALIGGLASNQDALAQSWKLWVAASVLMPVGSGMGYLISYGVGLPSRACRTVCLETGLQNSTLALAVLAFSFPDPATFKAVSVFPLLYSLFLLVDGALITLMFNYLSRGKQQSESGAMQKAAPVGDEEKSEKEDSLGKASENCEDLVSVVI
mmetsp:Transcript_88447/g.156866  ORF Transcript_88447/g.156866 Transcript_88447/m.156866 type:complete len:327 (+) Transcript_88447:51-1031(+)|eukprot:CAMPEP_0197658950 /NCGR_PEP_ID=MMETSP1338-20131121/45547_1 /TAXON_ID=43686 ORGANISM="Pelagodinium beii, Strain RCC1491" /NCGR_SAMPLE_ID=MMETSP1338 /ASSEMBLY_ACC=CAM_ASM_000754 /LENGTH=326 /DNA_ID=CAMNT_0043235647 /DNA_START=51 /DNA_END=1034 /DNA_ORIENTATION=-